MQGNEEIDNIFSTTDQVQNKDEELNYLPSGKNASPFFISLDNISCCLHLKSTAVTFVTVHSISPPRHILIQVISNFIATLISVLALQTIFPCLEFTCISIFFIEQQIIRKKTVSETGIK